MLDGGICSAGIDGFEESNDVIILTIDAASNQSAPVSSADGSTAAAGCWAAQTRTDWSYEAVANPPSCSVASARTHLVWPLSNPTSF